jgi:hypothetical protein
MENELDDCLTGQIEVQVDRAIIIKVLKTIKIELFILKCRVKQPGLFDHETSKPVQPVGRWAGEDIELIELIYAIHTSVNHGAVSVKALQECFEYIFDIQLGNIETRLEEIKERQGNKAVFLESLIKNLNKVHDELSIGTSHGKLKWTGNVIDLVELVYAIHASGYTNNGKTSLKELFTVMGEVFDIEVKKFYRSFKDIKNRVKGDRTRFLDELKQALTDKMEKSDRKPSRK